MSLVCDNPFQLTIKKKSHKSDVRVITPNYLARCRQYLTNVQWREDTKLCTRCRCEASVRIKKVIERQEAGRLFVGVLADLIPALPVNQPEQPEGSPETEPLDSDNHQQASGSTTSSRADELQAHGGNGATRENVEANAVDVLPFDAESNVAGSNVLPGPSTDTFPESSIASSGALYTDRHVATDRFNRSTNILGVSPLAAGIARKPKEVLNKLQRASDKLKSTLEEATGTEIVDKPDSCECSYCSLMIKSIQEKFPELETKKEKYSMLTCLPPSIKIRDMQNLLQVSKYMARKISKFRKHKGPFYVPEFKSSSRPITDEVLKKVREYYLNDDNSYPSPSVRETVRVLDPDGIKRVHARRYMRVNSNDAYQEFKDENKAAKIGATKFLQLRPKQCKWPGNKGFPITCACIIHANFNLMILSMKNICVENAANADEDDDDDDTEQDEEDAQESDECRKKDEEAAAVYAVLDNTSELINFVLCPDPTEECFVGVCSNCPNQESIDLLFKYVSDDEIDFDFWETKPNTNLCQLRMPLEDFKDKFLSVLQTFLVHEYIYRQQKQFISDLKSALPEKPANAIINVDFGENYSFVVQTAVQGFHWSNNQATIHPFVIYFTNEGDVSAKYKTYFVISDEMTHDATTFHVFRSKVIALIKIDFPQVTHVDYFSDGAGSQYKNFKNVANLVYHQADYGLTANWHFTATSHGKSTCDAMSAVVKRTCRLKSIKDGMRILTATEMYNVVQKTLTTETMQIIFVSKEEVEAARTSLDERYEAVKKIPGIRKMHCFKVREDRKIAAQIYSTSDHHEVFTIITEDEAARPEEPEDSMQLDLGDYYAVYVCKTYQIGKVIAVNEIAEEFTMTMMKKSGKGGVALSWPPVERERVVSYNDILGKVTAPEISKGTGQTYRLAANDHDMVNAAKAARLRMFIENE